MFSDLNYDGFDFDEWVSGEDIDFESTQAEELYKERATRFRKAIKVERPDRVPVQIGGGYLAASYAGVQFKEAMYDAEKLGKATKKFTFEIEPDGLPGADIPFGRVLEILDYKMYKWPGDGLSPDASFQFVEKEYMEPDEYDYLIQDPTGFWLRKFAPRIAGELEGFSNLPQLTNPVFNYAVRGFASPETRSSLEALIEAAEAACEERKVMNKYIGEIISSGYPSVTGGLSMAPFDFIGDSLRGTKGIMLDMRRRPEKLKEAMERVIPLAFRLGAESAIKSGSPAILIPMHKGCDEFMSIEDYKEFYWPTLKRLMEEFINMGLVPWTFAEGSYDRRLDFLSDNLPDGSMIWHFERTDMASAKDAIGDKACIAGNVPPSLIKTGSSDEVKDYCHNLIDEVGPEGFILTLGATPNRAKAENLKAIVESAKDYDY